MNNKKHFVAGIDIGGSHITAGLVNMQTRKVENNVIRNRINSKADAEEILSGWCNAIRQLWAANQINSTKIGFAMPGPFDYENGICLIKGFDKYESLYELNIREILAERLQVSGNDIGFRNDAEAFLDGEIFCGAGQGYNNVIGITLGTGMGSALSHNGKTKDAELSVLPYKNEKIEEYVSTRAIIRFYKDLTGTQMNDVKSIAALYGTDAAAVEVFKTFSWHLAWFLEYFIKREQPQVLVIGGNITQSWNFFMDEVISELTVAIPTLPVIVKAALGEDAALIGGACCWLDAPTIPKAELLNTRLVNVAVEK